MAFAATVQWDVQTVGVDGNAGNGGGFDPVSGTPGTDLSQVSPVSFTDWLIGAVTTTATSILRPFTGVDVGNLAAVSSGGTVQRVQILSVSAGVATFDKSLGTAANSCVGNLGGPLASPGQAEALRVTGNTVHIKSATYTITSASTNIAAGCVSVAAAATGTANRTIGYQTTHGDGGTKPILKANGVITSFSLITLASGCHLENVELDGNNRAGSRGINGNAGSRAYNCRARNCLGNGYNGTSSVHFILCEATGCSSTPAFSAGQFYGCSAYSNTITGFQVGTGCAATDCVSVNNSGAASDGFAFQGVTGMCINCTAYGNGRAGFNEPSASPTANTLINCLAVSNASYGFDSTSGAYDNLFMYNCAGFFGTGTGNVHTSSAITAANNVGFITLTVDPFVASGSSNFALSKNVSGMACRSAGLPTTWPGLANTLSYPDVGAVQSPPTPLPPRFRPRGTFP